MVKIMCLKTIIKLVHDTEAQTRVTLGSGGACCTSLYLILTKQHTVYPFPCWVHHRQIITGASSHDQVEWSPCSDLYKRRKVGRAMYVPTVRCITNSTWSVHGFVKP